MSSDEMQEKISSSDINCNEALHASTDYDPDSEADFLRKECTKMAQTLKRLQEEEHILQVRNNIIARATVDAGYVPIDTKSWQLKAKKAKKQSKASS